MIYLHKILPVFLLPTGLTLELVLAGLLLRRKALIWAGVLVLWVGSTPLVSNLAMRAVEGWAMRDLAANAQEADAIVVLSAGRTQAPGNAEVSEWADADRFFAGVELYTAGKAPLLVFTAGWARWDADVSVENDVLFQYAQELGIPGDRLLTTAEVINTDSEARAVAVLLRNMRGNPLNKASRPRILLVTSAFHMRRASMLFNRAGLDTVPFPVDFQASDVGQVNLLSFLPNAGSLAQTERALRELYGTLYYLVIAD